MAPLLAAHPKAWPPGTCGLAEFEHACAMVQSRAFHLVKENWITAVESSGGAPQPGTQACLACACVSAG